MKFDNVQSISNDNAKVFVIEDIDEERLNTL
jgi:hypothetical protein